VSWRTDSDTKNAGKLLHLKKKKTRIDPLQANQKLRRTEQKESKNEFCQKENGPGNSLFFV
jgi:hypothetical protein